MKQTLLFVILGVFSIFVSQQTNAQSKLEKWKELKAFHTVMSRTFHPSENGDLKPIRERSGEMVKKAKELASSKIPDEFNNQTIKDAVNKLVADSEKLNQLIKNKGSDEDVKKALGNLHDTFHIIVEKCQG